MSGVCVSDGILCTTTDAEGRYSLASDKPFGYVFISSPSGYLPPLEGTRPQFFRYTSLKPSEDETLDFVLSEDKGQENHIMLCCTDFHMADLHSDREQFDLWADDVQGFVADNPGSKVYMLTAGDMSWDIYWKTRHYSIEDFARDMDSHLAGLPVFYGIGNHDHELEAAGERKSTFRYRKAIGPVYYSFNIGDVHYVVLDPVVSRNDGKGSRRYECRIQEDQMRWLEAELQNVDKSRQVVVVSHIPIANLEDSQRLLDCFRNFSRPVHFITGHFHSLKNEDRLTDPEHPYYDHMVGCVSGSLWMTGHYSPGINLCKDGTPGGYMVLYCAADSLRWQYKSTGRPLDYQFRLYDGNCVLLDPDTLIPNGSAANRELFSSLASSWMKPSSKNWLYLNVWNADGEWKVEMFEEGKALKVERASFSDPLHILSYPAKILSSAEDVVKPTQMTRKCSHFFRAKASRPDSVIEVVVTDRFGNVYRQSFQRPLHFDIEYYKTH